MRKLVSLAIVGLAAAGLAGIAQAQPPGGGGPGGGQFNIMQFVDGDKDGKVSEAEYATFADMRWTRISQGADKVKVADLQGFQRNAFAGITPDADGYVTKAAYDAAVPARFKAADTDGDGSLTQAELMASFPRRGPGGGN